MHKRPPERKKRYGIYTLDEDGAQVLQKFCYLLYKSYADNVQLPRNLQNFAYSDFRSKLYYRFYRDYQEGKVDYEFSIFDDEWVKLPVDLSRLLSQHSKEV